MWSLRRTENPRELDRNQPAPPNGDDSSDGQNAGLWIRRSRVRSPFFTQTLEACVSGLNSLPAKEVLPLRESKVRIRAFRICPDGEVANTSVCKTDIRRFESCCGLTQGIGAMVSADVLYASGFWFESRIPYKSRILYIFAPANLKHNRYGEQYTHM